MIRVALFMRFQSSSNSRLACAGHTMSGFHQPADDRRRELDVLQFALLLEYLEAEFYQRGVAASGLIDSADMTIFQTINTHETMHVASCCDAGVR
jgi:hypothetical protein